MALWQLATHWLWMVGIAAGIYTEFPNPQKDFLLCGRRNASFICDPEFLLDISDVDRLDYLARGFRQSTNCLCSSCETGISVGIFVKRNLTKQAIRMYQNGKGVAEMLRKRWRLGKCDDDIVILLLSELNISDYSMGPAVKRIFPEETARLIMRDCSIHFQSGWYYQGLESVLRSFNDAIVRVQKKAESLNVSLVTGLSLGIGVLLILLIISIILLRRQNKRRKRGCSNIYESVPTKNKYLSEKIGEYQLDKIQKQSSSDDDLEDDLTSDDENVIMPHRNFIQIKRQLSAVEEESCEEAEVFKKEIEAVSFNSLQNRSQQISEL